MVGDETGRAGEGISPKRRGRGEGGYRREKEGEGGDKSILKHTNRFVF